MTNQKSKLYKLQVFVPISHEEAVRKAIGDAGGGVIGNYDHCVSVTKSTGYFRPLENSNPAIGLKGEINSVEEVKLEFPCEESKISSVIEAIKKANIYEENLIDIIPMTREEDLR